MISDFVKSFLFLLILVVFTSCDSKMWQSESKDDAIKLSTRLLHFSSSESSETITTKESGWAINYSKVDDEYLVPHPFNPYNECYTIAGSWFTIEKVNDKTIHIKVEQNTSGKKRGCEVIMQSGDFFDTITISQEG